MNKKMLIKKCLIDEDCVETRPWVKDEYKDLIVIRHKSNEKWYALIFEKDDELCVNLKCPPDLIPVLKEQYDAVKPAWHMNKKHWCTVLVNNIPTEALDELIQISYSLTAPKRKIKEK